MSAEVSEIPAARPECEHYWAYHCYDGLSVRLCQLCHEPDWADVRRQQEQAATAERDRIRLGFFGCDRCGKIHDPIPQPGIQAASWASPDDGHPYTPHYVGAVPAALVAKLTARPT